MGRYFRLLRIFYVSSLLVEASYRLNFWSRVVLSLFWSIWTAIAVGIFFRWTDTIGGWTYNQALIVVGLFFMIAGFRQIVLLPNLRRISEYIRLGNLDYMLTKPVNSQFIISLRNINVFNIGDPVLGLGIVVYALWNMQYIPRLAHVLLFALLIISSCVLLYSISLILHTLTIWFVQVEQIDTIIGNLLETGRFPVSLYEPWIRTILTFVFPVALMTTVPAQTLIGGIDWVYVLGDLVATALLFVGASWFWRFALRFYSGASS